MFIELTRTTGNKIKVNVLSIDHIQTTEGNEGNGGIFSSARPEGTNVRTHRADFYVKESYNEVSLKIEKSLESISVLSMSRL